MLQFRDNQLERSAQEASARSDTDPREPRTGGRDRGPRHAARRRSDPQGFRPDIEGLRAVAVVTVLLYHAGVPFFTGGYVGVDVFLVISGYLITGLLLREVATTGTVSLTSFYARRIRRLLPMALLVLVTVAVLSSVLLSPVRRQEVAADIVAAGLYVVNWRFAQAAVDYFAADTANSPLQHYWSLAVEEQFYLVWPVLLLACAWFARRTGRRFLRAAAVAVLVVGLSSFACSLYLTYRATEDAYFSTLTRGWELAAGAALAVLTARIRRDVRLPRLAATGLAAAGLAAIAVATATFDDHTMFPGAAALLPVTGAGAVILAGIAGRPGWPARLLTARPVRHIGRISYSWYLWHWPMLVFATAVWGRLGALEGLLVVAASWIPTVVSHHVVEQPLRHASFLTVSPGRALRAGFAMTAAIAAVGCVTYLAVPSVPTPKMSEVMGAEAVREGESEQREATALRPDPRDAKQDQPRIQQDGCLTDAGETSSPACTYEHGAADRTVVLFGDSHMMQYADAVRSLASKYEWRLVVLTKSGCPPSYAQVYNAALKREYTECDEWRVDALARIEQENPALVITTGRAYYNVMKDGKRLSQAKSAPLLEEGYVSMLEDLLDRSDRVVVLRDNPKPGMDVADCVSASLDRLTDCAAPREKALSFTPVGARAAEQVEDVELVDLTPVFCPEDTCPAVIGDVLVYRDHGHLTSTFASTLTGILEEKLPTDL